VLTEKPALAARLRSALQESEGGSLILAETDRVGRVVLKLARGHAAFDLHEPRPDEPSSLSFVPLATLSASSRERFESVPHQAVWPEVESRAMQRLAASVTPNLEWIVVQPGRYRYLVHVDGAVTVRIVLSEYLACEVVWG
jgi:hypothetical protein